MQIILVINGTIFNPMQGEVSLDTSAEVVRITISEYNRKVSSGGSESLSLLPDNEDIVERLLVSDISKKQEDNFERTDQSLGSNWTLMGKTALAVSPLKPTASGLIPTSENDTKLDGTSVPIGDDGEALFDSNRKDLDIKVITRAEVDKFAYKNLKKNLVLKSKTFHEMRPDNIKDAIATLVVGEQEILRTTERENLLLIEIPPKLKIVSSDPKNIGSGEFHYEETVSVFENPKTLYTNPERHRESL